MGAFFKIFIAILCMNVLVSIAYPTESQWLRGSFFDYMLSTGVDPVTGETVYTDLSSNMTTTAWTEGGPQDTGFFQFVIDGLRVMKSLGITLINIAAVPILLAFRVDAPAVVRLMIFIPMAILYAVAAMVTVIRGVQV